MTTTVREARPAERQGDRTGRTPLRRRLAVRRPAPRPTTPQDDPRLAVSSAMTMVALLCLWLVLQLLVLGGLSHARSQELLYRELRTQLASATAPLGPVTPVGAPVAVLTIPSIGVEETVVEGTSSGDTLGGPGHLRNTVIPGQAGTSVVMGRGSTYGAPFGELAALRAGDTITSTTAQGTTDYTVIGVRRAGDTIPQPLATGSARLVLITSVGSGGTFSSLSGGSVLYVDADATTAFPAPGGLAAAVPESERPMQADTGSLPLLVLCLAGLLAICLGVVWARQRHSAALVWVVAAPVAVAATWATTDVAMRLLPNLL